MVFQETPLKGAYIVEMQPASDNRGWFSRYYCKNEFKAIGFDKEWVQMNQSFTVKKGALRGIHFQYPPFAEIKLVRCIVGKVFDVIVDLREGSETFLKWTGVELSAANKRALYIPEGFAHSFQTLEENCELIYAHSEFFTKGVEGGVRYDDPMIGVNWPLPVSEISERDANHQYLDSNFKGLKI